MLKDSEVVQQILKHLYLDQTSPPKNRSPDGIEMIEDDKATA